MKSKPISAAIKLSLSAAVAGALAIAGALAHLSRDGQSVLLESEESRTVDQGPVFNRIRYFPSRARDVWMMQQSHHGLGAGAGRWDRLAIVVDKTRSPWTARFLQLDPGPLEWKDGLEARAKPYRVSCFMCHSNGPRAIRPNGASAGVRLSFADRARVLAWNLRIKTYGRVVPSPLHEGEDRSLRVPFRLHGQLENEKLAVKTCVRCHREEGAFARGALTRQNAMTIQFMVSRGHMPPPGFPLSADERERVERFVQGF